MKWYAKNENTCDKWLEGWMNEKHMNEWMHAWMNEWMTEMKRNETQWNQMKKKH